jgi:hypothetical protein
VKTKILPTAQQDARWFRMYYSDIFPQGRRKAERQLNQARMMIERHPLAGVLKANGKTQTLVIGRTPFSLEYAIFPDFIGILRIRDQRSDPSRLSDDDLQ